MADAGRPGDGGRPSRPRYHDGSVGPIGTVVRRVPKKKRVRRVTGWLPPSYLPNRSRARGVYYFGRQRGFTLAALRIVYGVYLQSLGVFF